MNKELEFLQNIFTTENETIDIPTLLIKIIVVTILSLLISFIYVKFGNSLSNRKTLSRSFVLIALATMIIITIVKSSLALSLGLVGALSIVRFRTAIKEPEELAYFFIVIAIGLGVGAGQMITTTVSTFCIGLVIFILNRKKEEETLQNLVIQFNNLQRTDTKQIIEILQNDATQLALSRLDESPTNAEISFSVHFKDIDTLLTAKEKLQQKFPQITFSFIELQ